MPIDALALAALLAAPIELARDVGWIRFRAPVEVRTGDSLKITGLLANYGDYTENVWVEAHDLSSGETVGRSLITVIPYYFQNVVFTVSTGGYATGPHRFVLTARLYFEGDDFDDEPEDNVAEIVVGVYP